jgi:nucleoside-diphosphate-sugar epimerase
MKNKVFITGASGFIGTNLLKSLLNLNVEIAIMDHAPHKNIYKNQIIQYTGDIMNPGFK